ncbi:MAG: hypothetical protein KF760_01160 [Candidatus Eremiobacteraeota bacterium]|nr:hypothetical protein [Candidatus Eremiobacteraeota bacterium]MCW5868066.1 hypothetical protein [Candidatus Eremiobacteraeota bacterium]
MDRSFLSRPEVVRASRKFVCIRLATYESLEEARMLRSIFRGGSGQLENTTFALLSPDGRTPLVYSGRSPDFAFVDSQQMATTMGRISERYRGQSSGELPTVVNLRLAVNLAACDGLPVVALTSPDGAQLRDWQSRLAAVAWEPALLGKAIYCLDQRATPRPGLLVLAPGKFGLDSQPLGWLAPDSSTLSADLQRLLNGYRGAEKNAHDHLFEGHQRGVHWQTQIPVTDPHR